MPVISAEPYDRLAKWYDAMYAAMGQRDATYSAELADSLVSLIERLGVTSILDCSCGTGDPILGLSIRRPSLRIHGTDASQEMLSRCRGNAASEGVRVGQVDDAHRPDGPGVALDLVAWMDLPEHFPSHPFDLTMCRGHALYHLITPANIVEALRCMAAVTRPGGYVLADTLPWTDDLRGEIDRPALTLRGWLEGDDPHNPMPGQRLAFLVSSSYREDPRAVRSVVQTKTLHVANVRDDELTPVASVGVEGAVFTGQDLAALMVEAGLSSPQYISLRGRTPAWETVVAQV